MQRLDRQPSFIGSKAIARRGLSASVLLTLFLLAGFVLAVAGCAEDPTLSSVTVTSSATASPSTVPVGTEDWDVYEVRVDPVTGDSYIPTEIVRAMVQVRETEWNAYVASRTAGAMDEIRSFTATNLSEHGQLVDDVVEIRNAIRSDLDKSTEISALTQARLAQANTLTGQARDAAVLMRDLTPQMTANIAFLTQLRTDFLALAGQEVTTTDYMRWACENVLTQQQLTKVSGVGLITAGKIWNHFNCGAILAP